MKKGAIIYNQSFKDKGWNEGVLWYKDTAKRFNIDLAIYTNTEIVSLLLDRQKFTDFKKKYAFVLFLDKDIRLARTLESLGCRIFNSSRSIEICDDKTLTQLVLVEKKIPTPRTIIAPMFFFKPSNNGLGFLRDAVNTLSLPLILKEGFGSHGEQVYMIKTMTDLKKHVGELYGGPLLFQKFIKESKGRDVRMYVVGGKFVGACLRSNKSDFRANTELGGELETYKPTKGEIKLAELAAKCIGLDFAGVDILFGKDGPLVCEVNSNSYAKKFYEVTKIDVGGKIFEHITKQVWGTS